MNIDVSFLRTNLSFAATINLTSVACDFPIRDKHEQFNILTITLIVITGVTVGLRFVEKIRYGPGLQIDDYVITGAFVSNLWPYCLAIARTY